MAIQTCVTTSIVEHRRYFEKCFIFLKKIKVSGVRFWTPLTFIVWTKTFYKMFFRRRNKVIQVLVDMRMGK